MRGIDSAHKYLETREGRKITQSELSDLCGWGGNQARVSHYKKDRRVPTPNDLLAISEATGVRVEWLQFGTGEMTSALSSTKKSTTQDNRIDSKALSKSIRLVEAVIQSGGYTITEDEKANIMAVIYDEIMKGDEISEREIALILKASSR